MEGRRILVTGRVQGVGYRAFVHRSASLLGVRGSVWNRRDGDVEINAGHEDPEILAAFVRLLTTGPGSAENIVSQELPDASYDPGFFIAPTQ